MRSQEHTCPPLKMHLPPAALGNTSARGTSRSETALAASSTSRPQERHSAPSVHLQCPEPPSVSHGTHCHTLGPAMSQALGISFLAPLLLEKETAPCRCPGASDPPPKAEPSAPLHSGSTAQVRWGASLMASPLAQQGIRLALLESHPGLEGQESDLPASRPPAVQKMHCTTWSGQAASPSLGIRAASKQTRVRRGRVSPSD